MAPDASGEMFIAVLNDRFEILADAPLPQYDSPRAAAYAARDLRDGEEGIFALVCDPDLPPRMDILGRLGRLGSAELIRLRDYGVVSWAKGQGYRVVLIYDRPAGSRLIPGLNGPFAAMSEERVIGQVLTPVVATLKQLSKQGVTHRAIRPSNMFVRDEDGVVLGECASVPPAFDQPPVFETIGSLMADPAGRGTGEPADDVYALGVTVLALITGEDPAAGRDSAQLLAEKMVTGSYHALVGAHRLPDAIRDLLRGMLEDRAHARWRLDDLSAWLEDRDMKPIRSPDSLKPERAFAFAGHAFHEPRALATALAGDWDDAELPDGGHEILHWARQSLGDDDLANRVLTAIEMSKRDRQSRVGGGQPALIARLCMALDNAAPIRYKRVSAYIDGLGSLLAVRFRDQAFQRDATEIFRNRLPGCSMRMVEGSRSNAPGMARAFARFARFVESGGIGGGIERCLYELMSHQYCHSPLIADQKVMRIEDLLPALERIAGRGHSGPPVDRHIAAFIAARCEVNVEGFLKGLNSNKTGEDAVIGMLGLLAAAAAKTKGTRHPDLARWISKHIRPAVESYHHRSWRAKAEAELPAVIESGDIVAIYRFVANSEIRRRDRDGFAQAQARCRHIDRQIAVLSSPEARNPRQAAEYGHGLAVTLSAILGLTAMATTVVLVLH
ncbi:MAG: hypothetical protein R3229_03830 [Alphaproteobacteria bacterium]|nr:hypothetical protein [Alphaproteobacteria bacterium]